MNFNPRFKLGHYLSQPDNYHFVIFVTYYYLFRQLFFPQHTLTSSVPTK